MLSLPLYHLLLHSCLPGAKQQPWRNRLPDFEEIRQGEGSDLARGRKRPGKGGNRFWKSIGLSFKTPRDAIEGTYIDRKCPFTGTVSIRGRILAGTCHSAKMQRTIIVRRNYLHFVNKYQRYEKRHSNIPAHVSPCFRVKEGDHVIIEGDHVIIESASTIDARTLF